MGFSGQIECYSTERPEDPARLLRRLLAHFEVEKVRSAVRYTKPFSDWEAWQRLEAGEGLEHPPYEYVKGPMAPDEAVALLVDDLLVWFSCDASPVSRALSEACGRIPREIGNGFVPPSALRVTVGWKDLIDGNSTEPFLVARSYVTVGLSGSGAPNDWPETIRLIGALPEAKAFKAHAEEVVGPMELRVYWD